MKPESTRSPVGQSPSGKAILHEHHVKLPGEVGRRKLGGIGPQSFQKVDMAVPETGRNRRARRVDDAGPSKDPHGRAAPHGHDLAAIDQDGAVADGVLSVHFQAKGDGT
jgi:hypothetical protein